MAANRQWSSRPADERFLSIDAMLADVIEQQKRSAAKVISSRELTFAPSGDDHKGLTVSGKAGVPFAPTHHAFNQLCQLAGAPAGYLRELPSELAADNLNYGFQVSRDVADVGLLLERNGSNMVRAATGPNYGRIWDSELIGAVRSHFGNGFDGRWHIPGEFNAKVSAETMTKEKTTLYRGDRDCWLFLCDGANDIEIPNRRHGQPGKLQRGFFAGNSEVGGGSLFGGFFVYDFMCCNHIIWGMDGFEEIRIRHTKGAPDRWIEELLPVLQAYANSDTRNIKEAIATARSQRLEAMTDKFLANRFGPKLAAKLDAVHVAEEGRPMETVWDAATAATAYARALPFIGDRVAIEREAGKLLIAA
jgi:hypothetical protein